MLAGQAGGLSQVPLGIMEQYHIPCEQRLEAEASLTADGAAILAALAPDPVARDQVVWEGLRVGFGVGEESSALAPCYGALRLLLD